MTNSLSCEALTTTKAHRPSGVVATDVGSPPTFSGADSTGDAGLEISTKPISPSLALVYMSVRPSTVAATISAELPLTLCVATRVKKPPEESCGLALTLFGRVTLEKLRPDVIATPSSADNTILRDL